MTHLTSKRVDGNYSLVSTNPIIGWNGTDPGYAEIKFDTNLVRVSGNLLVEGTAVFIDEETVTIADNIVILNKGESGAGVTPGGGTSGLQIDRGSELDAFILWSESNNWVVNIGDGAANLEIVTKALGTPSPLYNLIQDLTPQLGGDLDTLGNTIRNDVANGDIALETNGSGDITLTVTATGKIRADGPIIITGSAPPVGPVAGEVAIYQAAGTCGSTQIFYQNFENAVIETGELISKNKAFMYSLIF